MKILKKYLVIFILASIGSIAILNSCKKIKNNADQESSEQKLAASIKALKDKYGSISAPEIYPVDKIADGFYINQNGQEISLQKQHSGIQSAQSCSFDCNTASDPSDLDLTYTLSYVQRFFYCGNTTGGEVRANWDISVPYTILAQNPNNPLQKSRGRMRIKSPTGAVLVSNINLQPISITANGPDPNCGSNQLFTITYSWAGVPDSYFANGNKLECSLFSYNDCDLTANNYLTSWELAYVFQGVATYSQPCSRIDKLWINNSYGNTPNECATAGGAYLLCPSYPFGFVPTTSQQVEYRVKTNPSSNNWLNQDDNQSPIKNGNIAPVGGTSPTVSACCGVLNLTGIYQGGDPLGLGWLVRYRNIHAGCQIGAQWVSGSYITQWMPY
jgi:hypothetical protein